MEETKKKTWVIKLGDWCWDCLTRRVFITFACLMLSLVFLRGGPLTLTFGDGSDMILFEKVTPRPDLGIMLFWFGIIEFFGLWTLIFTLITRVLAFILKPLYEIEFIKRLVDKYSKIRNQRKEKDNDLGKRLE